jgi:hypothetical protein
LVAPCESYSFFDLIQLKKVRDLRARRVASATILRSLQAMQKQVAGMENPFLESGTYAVGRRIAFRHGGHSFDPVAGQFLMDFDPTGRLLPARAPKVHVIADAQTAADFFQRGVALEDDPNTHDEAIAVYAKVLEMDSTTVGISGHPNTTIARRLKLMRNTRSHISIWGMCLTRRVA